MYIHMYNADSNVLFEHVRMHLHTAMVYAFEHVVMHLHTTPPYFHVKIYTMVVCKCTSTAFTAYPHVRMHTPYIGFRVRISMVWIYIYIQPWIYMCICIYMYIHMYNAYTNMSFQHVGMHIHTTMVYTFEHVPMHLERWGAGVEYHFQEFNEPYAPS